MAIKPKTINRATVSGFSIPLRKAYTVTSEFGLRSAPSAVLETDYRGIDLAISMNADVFTCSSGHVEQVGSTYISLLEKNHGTTISSIGAT